MGGASRAGWAGRAAAEGGACRRDFPWAELRSGCAGNGVAGPGGEACGWARVDPSVLRAGFSYPGVGLGQGALLGGGEPLGRYSCDRGEHACVRVFQRGRAAALSVFCPSFSLS